MTGEVDCHDPGHLDSYSLCAWPRSEGPVGNEMTSGEARFKEIHRACSGPIDAYCRRRLSPELAKDAAADTFLIAWRKIDEAPPGSDALPWLYGIARGVVSNARRSSFRAGRLSRKVRSIGIPRDDSPDDVVVSRHESSQILIALDELGPSDQEVLRLSIWEELSGRDLAIALETSEEAARQRLSRAKGRLAASYNRLERRGWQRPVALERGVR